VDAVDKNCQSIVYFGRVLEECELTGMQDYDFLPIMVIKFFNRTEHMAASMNRECPGPFCSSPGDYSIAHST
jgi:hypothetical protein